MKRLASIGFTVVMIIAVAFAVIAFSRHNGPGDSPRDDNNLKTTAEASAPYVGGAGVFVRV
jgi:hypothetical protein